MDDMFENKNSADAGNSEPGFSEKAKEDEPVSFDARQQNFDDTAEPVISVKAQADGTSQQEPPNTDVQPNFSGIYNDGFNTPPCTINYTPVTAVKDYKPVSRGLKYFAAVLAGVILLTAASAGGYFLGRSSVRSVSGGNAKIELAAKPANGLQYRGAGLTGKRRFLQQRRIYRNERSYLRRSAFRQIQDLYFG